MKLFIPLPFLLLYWLICGVLANTVRDEAVAIQPRSVQAHHSNGITLEVRDEDDESDIEKPPRLANATQADIDRARAIINAAMKELAVRNKARLDHPLRNNYQLRPGSGKRKRNDPIPVEDAPPLFNVTEDIAAAAALVAEADAYEEVKSNSTLRRRANILRRARESNYWMANRKKLGSWPFGNNPSSFTVFRDVTKYGAKGDGVTDDTEAIRKAVSDGNMCGPGCYSSTTKGAIIYFPPGEYLVSGTIETYYGTQFIGDPNDRPVIKAASSFVGLGVISTDKYVENGGIGSDGNAKQWFINTANFYRQIRNFVIDITATYPDAYVCGLHYQVAQATSLQFVEFRARTGTTQQGIFAENGSGGFMSDLVFNGGNFGIYGGNQQFTSHRLTFNGLTTAVQLIWDWGWAWKSIYIKNCKTGFKLISEDGVRNTGSLLLTDSVFDGVDTAILTFPAQAKFGDGTTGLTLDNIKFVNTKQGIVDTEGTSYLGTSSDIDTFVLGRIYVDQNKLEALSVAYRTKRDPLLVGDNPWGLPKSPYHERAKPQYEKHSASQFRHVRDSCKGDGKTDDTQCIQNILNDSAGKNIVFFDAGSYIITDTITVPPGSVIVGENWSQLVAYGSKFGDATKPRPLIRVGQKGQVGTVEMQDLLFTSKGPTAGVVFVEWNIKSSGNGGAAMWDCHVRVGGAVGTDLTVKECPAGSQNDKCKAGSALMHITSGASGYFENVWLWVADHDIDDPDWQDDNNFMEQCSVFVARGLLVESKAPVWLYGTSSEHAVFYQYEFFNAKHLVASMIQTESPYYQPKPSMPEPFRNAIGALPGDPAYRCDKGETCDSSWALRIVNSSDVMIHGAGLYSWFNDYTQECLQTVDCQKSLIDLQGNFGNVRIHNLITIGAVNMIESDGLTIKAKDNQAVDFHPRWSQISVFDPRQFTDACTGLPLDTNPEIREGEYYAYQVDPRPRHSQLTIVNGSPYDFKLLGDHQYQMLDWDWVSVPAGSSAQFKINWGYGWPVPGDSAGEAYFQLDGTDKTFHVEADWVGSKPGEGRVFLSYTNLETRDVRKGSFLDLGWPVTNGNPIQWVLTGSEKYGFWTNLNPPVTWMQAILDVIGDRKLKYICMPGSHDAGISRIDGHANLGNAQNTRTQGLDIYGQLYRGSRWFDIRPCIGNGGKYMLCHYGEKDMIFHGANGLSVDDMIEQINRFMDEYPGELVILDVNDESGYDTDVPHTLPGMGYYRLTTRQWRPIIERIRDGIKKQCKGFGTGYLGNITLNEFIGDGQGCVLTIVRNIRAPMQPERGLYVYGQLGQTNQYSDTNSARRMGPDQLAKMKLHRRLGPEGHEDTRDGFFILSWTLTYKPGDLLSLMDMASIALNTLFWQAYHQFTPYSYPNVLYVDYLGLPYALDNGWDEQQFFNASSGHMIALAMAVNLQIASQNCYVGGGKMPV